MPTDDAEDVEEGMEWIVWGALTFSIPIYAGTAYYLSISPDVQRGDGIGILYLPVVMLVFSFVELGTAFWLKQQTTGDLNEDYTLYVVAWALAESVAIYGLMLWFVGAVELTAGWSFMGLALVAMLGLAPYD